MKCPDRWSPGWEFFEQVEPLHINVPDTPTVYGPEEDYEDEDELVDAEGNPISPRFPYGFCKQEVDDGTAR